MPNDQIKESLDLCLAKMTVSRELQVNTFRKVTACRCNSKPFGGPKHKKLWVSLALIGVLLITSAAAITIIDIVSANMQPIASMYIDGSIADWDLSDKLAIIDHMIDWGIELDTEKLELIGLESTTDIERETLANELITDVVGDRLKEYRVEQGRPLNQPEEHPIPDNYVLYEILWLMNDPNATKETIQAAYDEWEVELRSDVAASIDLNQTIMTASDQPVLKCVDCYMAEVLSMSKKERGAASITTYYSEQLNAWQVVISISGSDLRDQTKHSFESDYCEMQEYDIGTDTYHYYLVLTADLTIGDGHTLDGYEFSLLVPREAYPSMPDKYVDYPYFDPHKQFMLSSPEEKAIFSQRYKPIVDRWLALHPEFETWLSTQRNYLYRITRNAYGKPSSEGLQQATITQIAYQHCISIFPSLTVETLQDRYYNAVYYDVTNPAMPIWKIALFPDPDRITSADVMENMFVVINPWDGTVVRDHQSMCESDVEY